MTAPHHQADDNTAHSALSRRAMLIGAGAAAAAVPFGILGAANALTGTGPAPLLEDWICRAAAPVSAAVSGGEPRKLKLAWNATAICTSSAPVAKERGIFASHGLDVEFINFGGSTEQLLKAIATGKADAGISMALRWIKPLEQGFACASPPAPMAAAFGCWPASRPGSKSWRT